MGREIEKELSQTRETYRGVQKKVEVEIRDLDLQARGFAISRDLLVGMVR